MEGQGGRSFPWEVVVTPEDGHRYVVMTVMLCVALQISVRHIALRVIGRNSPKRGLAPRIGVKFVSVIFDIVAVAGGLKELLAPEQSVILDPIYGYSCHSQFHFSVAAGYFGWAAVVTLLYRGSNVCVFHHVACFLTYMLTLHPFLHHIGNVFLLFQADTLLIDLYSLSKILGIRREICDVFRNSHALVNIVVRIIVGLPMSIWWVQDMVRLLLNGNAHSEAVVAFMIVVNVIMNGLNVYWGFGILSGLPSKPACSTSESNDENSRRFFDIGINVTFGERKEPRSKAPRRKTTKKNFMEDHGLFLAMGLVSIAGAARGGVEHHISELLTGNQKISNAIGSIERLMDRPILQKDLYDLGLLLSGFLTLTLFYYACKSVFLFFDRHGWRVFHEGAKPQNLKSPIYTRIRGVWYDMKDFDHPGGPVAIALAQDRDATALFESHHYLMNHDKLYAILGKYKVPDDVAAGLKTMDPRDDGAHYDWDSYDKDPFANDVKEMLKEHFLPEAQRRGISLREATKATPQRWCMILSLMAAFFATLPSMVRGEWWTLLATPILAWIVIANYWHDGLHFSLSCDWRINAVLPYLFPWLSSPWMWYHQHVIGHHCYTNIAKKDPDLAHAPQLMREHESIRWRPNHRYQDWPPVVIFIWTVAVGAGLQILSDVRANLKGTYNNSVSFRSLARARLYAHTAGRVIYVFSLFIWPFLTFPLWKAVIFAYLPISVFSWCFMINSQVNHLTPRTAHASDPNFLKHQIVTAQDFGPADPWCFFASGGLNLQIEHHLFPCVNHCHLPALQPKVKALCKKHGVPYNEASGYAEALKIHIEHTNAMGQYPFVDGDHDH